LYALDTDSNLPTVLTREELEGVIQGHIIEEAELTGRYQHADGACCTGTR
jgi:phosphatidylethanolamine-binding protein (PEBP) family uncharacterized protein